MNLGTVLENIRPKERQKHARPYVKVWRRKKDKGQSMDPGGQSDRSGCNDEKRLQGCKEQKRATAKRCNRTK